MPTCEICDAVLDDGDDAICASCEHEHRNDYDAYLDERETDHAREQKMRFFSRYGD